MSKQVGKSDVFTKTKLIELQDKMSALCIASFNKEYELNNVLETKQKAEIDDLKEENSKLKRTINYFENLFDRLVIFIKNKIFAKEKNREDYIYSKEHKDIEKDN